MKEVLKNITEWFGKVIAKKVSYTKEGINPTHDWYVILMSTFVLTCLGAGIAYYFYTQINQGKLFSSDKDVSAKAIIIDDSLLKKTIYEINERRINLSEFKQNRIIPENPSF